MIESPSTTTTENTQPARWLHRLAMLIVCLVWPLIWVGGLVTTYDAGMAVPDWPGTYGSNLFLYPYQTWLFGPFDLFIEHGHRLLGAVVGFVAIAAVVVAWTMEPRRWVKWLSVVLLAAVIGQGVLGGMRVVLSDRTLAMAHGCTGPLFFVICVSLAVVTSRWWWTRPFSDSRMRPTSGGVRLAFFVAVLAYGQLFLGAQLRHVQATSSPGGFTHLVSTHITGAFVLWVLTGFLAWSIWRASQSDGQSALQNPGCGDLTLLRPCYLLVGFVGLQIVLGFGTWIANYGWPRFVQVGPFSAGYLVKSKAFTESLITTSHVATGSLILAMAVMIWLRSMRVRHTTATSSDQALSGEGAESPAVAMNIKKKPRLQVT